MTARVVSWDYDQMELGRNVAVTWVQSNDGVKVCGGLPNIVAYEPRRGAYRHTPDGRLWKLARITVDEP